MPQVGSEVGPSEDLFEVYIGGEGSIGRPEYPLDAPSIWRYMGKNALDGPQVKAVEELKNAITESEQAKKQKP